MSFGAGATIVLVVIIVELFAAYMVNGSATAPGIIGCNPNANVTSCETVAQTSFIESLLKTSVTGFSGLDPFVNLLWVVVMGGLLTIGIIMIVKSFFPAVAA